MTARLVDLAAQSRKRFEDGTAKANVPDLIGIGQMSDGDQTSDRSSTDYGDFTVLK